MNFGEYLIDFNKHEKLQFLKFIRCMVSNYQNSSISANDILRQFKGI